MKVSALVIYKYKFDVLYDLLSGGFVIKLTLDSVRYFTLLTITSPDDMFLPDNECECSMSTIESIPTNEMK